ncbi:50S ribosomal protein L31e [Candidatus Bathyarchaeota archaeon]|nr:50S ribosomal protein L31e [Candidatus Bathyarchaeota archaeon]
MGENIEAKGEEQLLEEEVSKEVKPKSRDEGDIVEERFYTIPLGKAWIAPSKKRAPRAIRIIRDFIKRHMKVETLEGSEGAESRKIIISNEVNEKIWERGIEKPPRKIRVKAVKDREGNVTVYLAEGD